MRYLKKIITVPKQGIEHFECMLLWLRTNVGSGNFEWSQRNTGLHNFITIDFYDEEAATAFKLAWG